MMQTAERYTLGSWDESAGWNTRLIRPHEVKSSTVQARKGNFGNDSKSRVLKESSDSYSIGDIHGMGELLFSAPGRLGPA